MPLFAHGCERLLSRFSTAFSIFLFSVSIPDSFTASLLHACFAAAVRLVVFLSENNTVSHYVFCCVHVAVISRASHYSLFLFVSKAGARNRFNPAEYSSSPCCSSPLSSLSSSQSYITTFCLLSLPPCLNENRLLIFFHSEAYLITMVIRQPELNSREALAAQ